MQFEDRKNIIISILDRLFNLTGEIHSIHGEILGEKNKLLENRFHLVVLGQFKRGKTTFINAILGEPLLPTAVIPLTSVLTLIHYGEKKKIYIIFQNHQKIEISPAELDDYITERGNPHNKMNVQYVDIFVPADFLHNGITLIDTPGIGSLFQHNTKLTFDFLPHVDAGIVILSADPPVTQTEYEFLIEVTKHVDHNFFVLNKIDLLNKQELKEASDYTSQALSDKLNVNEIMVHPLSARNALLGKMETNQELIRSSNLKTFEQHIRSFLQSEKGMILLKTSEKRIQNMILEIRFHVDLEIKAVLAPEEELQSKIKEFNDQMETIKKDQERFEHLLHADVNNLEKWIKQKFAIFEQNEIKHMRKMISLWEKEQGGRNGKEFIQSLDNFVYENLKKDFDDFRNLSETEIIRQYETLLSEYTTKINHSIQQIRLHSANLFYVTISPVAEDVNFTWKKSFYYKLEEEPLFLEIDFLKILTPFLPQSIVHKQFLQRILKQLDEKVIKNCGGLHYEYVYSIQEHVRSYQFELAQKMDQMIQGIHTILQRTLEKKLSDHNFIQKRITELHKRLQTLADIQKKIGENNE
jgi:signal recognition particle receptor subunit beta